MNARILLRPIQKFLKVESIGGIVLFGSTLLALAWANSPWGDSYQELWQYKIGFSIGDFSLFKPLILWINDGLMALFFFVVGLEIKRELIVGELNTLQKASLPIIGAVGGMAIPILVFLLLSKNPDASHGWGIPMATDIAFTLAILKTLGNRIPLGLKVFLTAFAIVDDIGAVLVIALFYSESVEWTYVLYAAAPLALLYFLSLRRVYAPILILLFGIVIWYLFLKSGLHPTIAGILLAFAVPLTGRGKRAEPLPHLEHQLHNYVAYLVVPLFALSNAGISFGMGISMDWQVVIAIAAGLVVGKVLGVGLLSFLGVRLGWARLPESVNFKQIFGVAFLAGVGFTMSLFIANLAFVDHPELMGAAKVGILIGSAVAGAAGWVLLRISSKKPVGA